MRLYFFLLFVHSALIGLTTSASNPNMVPWNDIPRDQDQETLQRNSAPVNEYQMAQAFDTPNYVHLNVYIDKPSFEQHSNSEQETKKFVKELIEGVTRKYTSALNYHLIVHELKIWKDDRINAADTLKNYKEKFEEWIGANCRNDSFEQGYDMNAIEVLITNRFPAGEDLGAASSNHLCSKDKRKMSLVIETRQFYDTQLTLAHELGHMFGASHDPDPENATDVRICLCDYPTTGSDKKCTMFIKHTKLGYTAVFSFLAYNRYSNCSQQGFANHFVNHGYCKKKIPRVYGEPAISICGNSVVEPGEECDCSPSKISKWNYECKFHKCCEPDTCKKKQEGSCQRPATSERPMSQGTTRSTAATTKGTTRKSSTAKSPATAPPANNKARVRNIVIIAVVLIITAISVAIGVYLCLGPKTKSKRRKADTTKSTKSQS